MDIMIGSILGIFIVYIITSLILLKRPTIIHEKRRRHFYAAHISHRGGAGERLENTLPAFQRAINLSTDMLELDCHLLANGDVVVSHDSDLFRLTGVQFNVSDFTIETLPPLLDTLQLTFAPEVYVTASTPEERKFILLKDVFKHFPNIPINIDIKINSDELIKKVNELVCMFNREHITIWGNRNHIINMKCLKTNKNIGTLFSQRRIIETVLLFYSGLLPFFPLQDGFFEIPKLNTFLEVEFQKFKISEKTRWVVWLFDKLLMHPALIKHLKERGIPTYVWVCNTEQQFYDAFEAGAEGVMTDFPTLLRQFLNKYPRYQCYESENNQLAKNCR